MMLFKWSKGRQEGSYWKFPFISSKTFGCDAYILSFPKGCSVMKHTDPVSVGYKHYRLNVTLKKSFAKEDAMYSEGPVRRWWRMELFRPDLYPHGLRPIADSIVMLSFGCRIKV